MRSLPQFASRVYPRNHCSHMEPLTPSTCKSPFPFTPGVSTICHEHGSREEEKKQHHQDAPSCTPSTPSYPTLPFPRRRNGLSYGFSLSGEQAVCGRPKTLVQPRYFVFYSSFLLCFCHWAAEKGQYRFRLILKSHTRYLISHRPFVLEFLCPRLFVFHLPYLSYLSCLPGLFLYDV